MTNTVVAIIAKEMIITTARKDVVEKSICLVNKAIPKPIKYVNSINTDVL
ncbi:hypothetical protein GF358_01530 [Candidatus Woesearchaeota archaeon]|nr:hypothetical protein [Candidatus Woesearchaeota archaeon]